MPLATTSVPAFSRRRPDASSVATSAAGAAGGGGVVGTNAGGEKQSSRGQSQRRPSAPSAQHGSSSSSSSLPNSSTATKARAPGASAAQAANSATAVESTAAAAGSATTTFDIDKAFSRLKLMSYLRSELAKGNAASQLVVDQGAVRYGSRAFLVQRCRCPPACGLNQKKISPYVSSGENLHLWLLARFLQLAFVFFPR